MPPDWCRDVVLLGDDAPLPLDRPFTLHEARRHGVSDRQRLRLIREGLLRPVLHGVNAVSQLPDNLATRAAALRLVVPDHCIVVDRTAGWLHGVPVLARGSVVCVPPLDVFSRSGSRMRRDAVRSGTRDLAARDITDVDGLAVTTQLRTACDLGRGLWRYDALSAIDAFLRAGVVADWLLEEVDRFKGHRGVRQLRALAPLGDPGAESPPESALRLHWYDAGLPAPATQIWTYSQGRARFRIDVGDPRVRYDAEYYGEQFHGPDVAERDASRLAWLADQGWLMDVFTREDVYGSGLRATDRLAAGHQRAVALARRAAGAVADAL